MAITSFKAGDAISTGDIVYVDPSGFLYKGLATSPSQSRTVGISLDSASANSLVRVINDSVYQSTLTLTPGAAQYLSITTPGAIVDYSAWQTQFNALSASGAFLTQIGRALTTSNLEVEIQKPIYVTK